MITYMTLLGVDRPVDLRVLKVEANEEKFTNDEI